MRTSQFDKKREFIRCNQSYILRKISGVILLILMCALEKYKCSNMRSVYFALLKTYKEEIKLIACKIAETS